MSMSGKETIAGVRVLVCVAKADGVVHEEERKALAASLEGAPLPLGMTLETLLAESIDLDAQLEHLVTPEAKDQVFKSACSLAYADGACSPEEQKMLDHLQARLGIPREQSSVVARIFAEARDTVLPSNIQPIADPARRAKEIADDTLKYSVLSALLGAFPVPGLAIATDLAVVAVQVKLVRDVGQYYGHTVDVQAAKSLLYGLGLGSGARMAVANLAKVVPGWGSAFGGAAAFASTWGLGKVMDRFFASRPATEASPAQVGKLKEEFDAAQREGKLAYQQNRDSIAAREERDKEKLAALNADLAAGKIDQAEYERRVAALA
jgi:uncharacterized protein (DUF697 family)/uncharacterized tellurite resistance protein B-like protein